MTFVVDWALKIKYLSIISLGIKNQVVYVYVWKNLERSGVGGWGDTWFKHSFYSENNRRHIELVS